MRKFLAFMVAVIVIVSAGAAFAATVGHGGETISVDPQKNGNEAATTSDSGSGASAVQTVIREISTTVKLVKDVATVTTDTTATFNTSSIKSILTTGSSGGSGSSNSITDAKLESIVTAVANAVTKVAKTILSVLNSGSSSNSKPVDSLTTRNNSVLQVVSSDTTVSSDVTISNVTKQLSETGRHGQVPEVILPRMTPPVDQGGIYTLPMPVFKESRYGKKIKWNAFKGGISKASISAAAEAKTDGDDEAVFLNSKGDVITVVPGRNSEDIEPGFVTVMAYLEGGTPYEPVISVAESDLELSEFSGDVEVQAVVVEAVGLSDDFIVKAGYTPLTMDLIVGSGTWKITTAADKELENSKRFGAGSLPMINTAGVSPDGEFTKYAVAVSIDISDPVTHGYLNPNNGDILKLIPDINENPRSVDIDAKIYDLAKVQASGASVSEISIAEFAESALIKDLASLPTNSSDIFSAYVVFSLQNGVDHNYTPLVVAEVTDFATVAEANEITKPATASDEVDFDRSSGGCDVGFSALALAAVGGLLLGRKESR